MDAQQSGVRPDAAALERRALAIWPRLDRAALRRCGDDPQRIAALISRRTAMPPEQIVQVLVMAGGPGDTAGDEAGTWFG